LSVSVELDELQKKRAELKSALKSVGEKRENLRRRPKDT